MTESGAEVRGPCGGCAGLVTALLTVCFLVGAALGTLLAACTGSTASALLRDCLAASIWRGGCGIPALLWYGARFPLLAFVCGLLPPRWLLLPLLLAARGLLLGFSLGLLFCILGGAGLFWGVCTMGVSAALLVPCLFRLAVPALTGGRRSGRLPWGAGTLLFCLAMLACHTLYLYYLAPLLLTWIGS